MASVFSSYTASFHFSSDPNDRLTQSPRAGHGFRSPHPIHDSRVTDKLIRLLIATTAKPRIRNALHPLMEPRRMTPTRP